MNPVAVAPVVEQRRAVPVLGHVGPLVAAHFKLRLVPGGIAVRRALQVSERNVIHRLLGHKRQREIRAQQRLMLMPVDVRHEIDAVCVPVKADFLRNLRMHVAPCETDRCAQRSVLCNFQLFRRVRRPALSLVPFVDVPGVIVLRNILESREMIQRPAIRHKLTRRILVKEPADLAVPVESDAEAPRLKLPAAVRRLLCADKHLLITGKSLRADNGRSRGRCPVNKHQSAVFRFLHVPVRPCREFLRRDFSKKGFREVQAVENGKRRRALCICGGAAKSCRHDSRGALTLRRIAFENLLILRGRRPVHVLDGRSRKDVMELV